MARIMCARRLWTALEHARRLQVHPDAPAAEGALLGDWAATVARFRHHDFVLVVNIRTCLTLVFPLSPRVRFRANVAAALQQALQDHHAFGNAAVARECAQIAAARIERLPDADPRPALEVVEFICGIEMEYAEDVRRVQWNLNEFPHRREEPCVPNDAVASLFGESEAAAPWPARSARGRPHARGR